jgi:hypothetical protein
MPPALIGYFSRDAAAAAFGYSGGVARESTQLRVELASLSEVLQGVDPVPRVNGRARAPPGADPSRRP